MSLKRIDERLLKLLFLLAAGIIVFQALGRSSMTSLLFYMTFPVTVLLWLRTVRKTITGMDLLMLAAIAMAMIRSVDDLRAMYPDLMVLAAIPDMRQSEKKNGYYYSSYYTAEEPKKKEGKRNGRK